MIGRERMPERGVADFRQCGINLPRLGEGEGAMAFLFLYCVVLLSLPLPQQPPAHRDQAWMTSCQQPREKTLPRLQIGDVPPLTPPDEPVVSPTQAREIETLISRLAECAEISVDFGGGIPSEIVPFAPLDDLATVRGPGQPSLHRGRASWSMAFVELVSRGPT